MGGCLQKFFPHGPPHQHGRGDAYSFVSSLIRILRQNNWLQWVPEKENSSQSQIDYANTDINEVLEEPESLQGRNSETRHGHFEIAFHPIHCSAISKAQSYL